MKRRRDNQRIEHAIDVLKKIENDASSGNSKGTLKKLSSIIAQLEKLYFVSEKPDWNPKSKSYRVLNFKMPGGCDGQEM